MWPFDEEQDSAVADFNATAQEIVNYAPDADTGLSAMRDLYSQSEFQNNESAQAALESRSSEVRQKFDVRTPFNFDEAINKAPIMLDDIQGEGATPEDQRIDQLNKWETKNVAAIAEIPDPIYQQNKSIYTRDVQKAAVAMRREIYGEDNYWVSDWALRAGEGAVAGVSDLTGYHGLEDYFKERTKPEWDDTLGSAIAGTAGFAGTALTIGAATGGAGSFAYMGASGLGQVRKQYQEAIESGGTQSEAVGAAVIEGASQALQLGTGEKIIGGAVEKMLGEKTIEALGAQVFPRIAKNVAIGAGAGVVGQALGTESSNVGQGLDKPVLSKDTFIAGLAGGVVGGVVTGYGEYAGAKRTALEEALAAKAADKPLMSPIQEELAAQEASTALKDAVESVNGQAPPPHEGARVPPRAVDLENPKVVAEMTDGSKLVVNEGKVHTQYPDGTYGEAYQQTFFVTPEVAAKVKDKYSHDGVGVHLTVEGDKLIADSQFLDANLNVVPRKTGSTQPVVEASKEGTKGMVPIHANEVTHKNSDGKTIRTFQYEVGSPIASTAGAASITMQPTGFRGRMQDQFGQQQRQGRYYQELIRRLPPDQAERMGLSVTSYETDASGKTTEVQYPLGLYPTYSVEEGFAQAKEFIARNGIYDTLQHLSDTSPSHETSYLASELRQQLQEAQIRAENEGDFKTSMALDSTIGEAVFHEANVRGEGATILGSAAHIDAVQQGESLITRIRNNKRAAAQAEAAKELGVTKVDPQALEAEVEKHNIEIAAAKKDITDPVDNKIVELTDKKELLGKKKQADTNAKIEKHKSEIKDFKNEEAQAKEEVNKRRSEEKAKATEVAKKLREEKKIADDKVRAAEKEHGKANTKLIHEAERLQKAIDRTEESSKKIGSRNIKADPSVRRARLLSEDRTKEIRRLTKEKKSTELTDEQKKIQAQIDELKANRTNIADNSANKGQRLRLSKANQAKAEAQEKINRVQQKFEAKMREFPEEEQNKLRNLYKLLAQDKNPTNQLTVNQHILDIEAKHLGLNPESTDILWNYWRKNVLSGTDTAVRNVLGNFGALISTPVAHLATGNVTEAGLYVKGAAKGVHRGLLEAGEIMAGNRRARLTLNAGEKPEPVQGFRTTSGKPLAAFNPLNHLLDITEFMHRGLGAADAIFANSAKEGQAYMAAHMIEMKKIPAERWQQSLDQALWKTEEQKAQLNTQLDSLVEARKSVGIKTTERERNLMFYEAMEGNRANIINQIAERHADTNTFMQEPNKSFFGMLARGLNKVGTYEIPIGKYKIRPLKEELAFLNTAANIADYWLAHTPLGIGHALEIRRNQNATNLGALELRTKANDLMEQSSKFRERGNTEKADQLAGKAKSLIEQAKNAPNVHTLEMREHLGRMMVGTSAMLGFAAILKHFADDENPYVRFNGLAPAGERKKWQAEGRPEFSLQIGGSVIPKEMLGPLTLGLVFADNIVKATQKGQDLKVVGANTVLMSMGALSQLSFLKSAGDFFQMLHGGDPVDENSKGWNTLTNNVETAAASYLQPFIPASGFLRNIYKWYDGSPQETYNNFTAKMLNNIPFGTYASGAKPRLNLFGEPIKATLYERSPMNLIVSSIHDDPVTQWLGTSGYKITDQGPMLSLNKGEEQRFGKKRDAIGLYKDTLDQNESYDVLEIAGPEIKRFLTPLVDNPRFSTRTDINQQMINKRVNEIRAKARLRVLAGGY